MKRTFILSFLILSLLLLSGCGCEHKWIEANCISPRTCSLCSKTEGDIGDHTWQNATCSAPQTCETCGTIQGDPLPHTPGAPITSYDLIDAITYDITSCTVCDEVLHTDAEKTVSYIGESAFLMNAEDFVTRLNHVLSTRGNWTAAFENSTSDESTDISVKLTSDEITYAHISFYVPYTGSEDYTYRSIGEDEKLDYNICTVAIRIDYMSIAMQLTQTEDITTEEEFIELYKWMIDYYSENSESLTTEILLPIYKTIYPYVEDWEIEESILNGYFLTFDYLSTDILYEDKWEDMYLQYINFFRNKGGYVIHLSVTPDIFFNE